MKIKLSPNTPMPAYAKPGDAGFDLTTANPEPVVIAPDTTAKIPLGIAMEVPEGHFGFAVPRSSLSKRNLILANTVGIIDSGYRGEVMAVLRNIGTTDEIIQPGERLIQMAIVPFTQVTFEAVEELSTTERGTGGYGSTGT